MSKAHADAVPEEIVVGARWWRNQVGKCDKVSDERADLFFEALIPLMCSRFGGHWYESEPLRGQAYRAISLDTMNEVDAVLSKASQRAGIDLYDCFPEPIEHVIMWVDPGEVVVKIFSDQRHGVEETIYERSYNSYDQKREKSYSLAALTTRLVSMQPPTDEHDGFYALTSDGVPVQS